MTLRELEHLTGGKLTFGKTMDGAVTCDFDRSAIKILGGFIQTSYGLGTTKQEAFWNYAWELKGETLIIHDPKTGQRKYHIPETLRPGKL